MIFMNRRAVILGLGSTAAASAAVGTGAFSAAQLSDRDADIAVTNDADALLGLVPNDDIAGVKLVDGQLAISLADPGINVNSVYQFGAFVENDEDLDDAVDERFDPVVYEDDFDPETNFRSAFMLRNQSNNDVDVRLALEDFKLGNDDDEPKFLLQLHDADNDVRGIIDPNADENDATVEETPLGSGEAIGVSFIVNASDSSVGDEVNGDISVTAGEAL